MESTRSPAVLFVLAIASISSGCAGTRLVTPQIAPSVQAALMARMTRPIPPPRMTPAHDQISVVNRIDARVNSAAIRVCQRSFNNPHACESSFRKRTLQVNVHDGRINAFVGTSYDLTILGGLVRYAGSDDEIAAVLAHEYSHAVLGHVVKKSRNAALGMLAGIAAGTVIGAKTDNPDFIDIGAEVGAGIGSLVFSRAMEVAADHFGMFILHEAGYNVRSAAQFHIRLVKLQAAGAPTHAKGLLAFLGTHPSPERRIEKLIATEDMIAKGHRTPIWK